MRHDALDPDDPTWSSQIIGLSDAVARWTGNEAGVIEYSEAEVAELVRAGERIVADMAAEGIHLAGRVDIETHQKLVELSSQEGKSVIETVRDAAEALRRQRLGHRVAAELSALQNDQSAWNDYLGEAESSSVADGVG